MPSYQAPSSRVLLPHVGEATLYCLACLRSIASRLNRLSTDDNGDVTVDSKPLDPALNQRIWIMPWRTRFRTTARSDEIWFDGVFTTSCSDQTPEGVGIAVQNANALLLFKEPDRCLIGCVPR
jgi:hypothetical protein